MGQPAAKQGDTITAVDIHIIMIPAAAGAPVPTPMPHPFNGIINGSLSPNVNVMGMPAATQGSTAHEHAAAHPAGRTVSEAAVQQATIMMGSMRVMINGKPAARAGDTALTCNDPADLPVGTVVATGTVMIG